MLTHSYYGQQFLEAQDRALRLGGSVAPTGSAFENVEGFDVNRGPGVNGWDPAGTFGFCLGGTNGGWTPAIAWAAAKDPRTEKIYTVVMPSVHEFTPAKSGVGGTWKTLGPLPDALNSGAEGAMAVDTKRDRMLWVKGYGPNHAMVYSISAGTWSDIPIPVSEGKAAFEALRSSVGMVYVAEIDKFLVRAAAPGPKVFVVDPDTFAVTFLATTGGDAVPRAAILSSDVQEGVYTRWLSVPRLGGVVYFPDATKNGWFLRLY